MMIEALFKASSLDKRYEKLAHEKMQVLLDTMYIKGVLYHQSILGKKPVQKALLEDYSFLVAALIQAYEVSYKEVYLSLAKTLSTKAIKKFYKGRYWYLSDDGLKVHADMQDKYYKAPINKLLLSLLKIASLTGERSYLELAQKTLHNKSARLKANPSYFPSAIEVVLREKRGLITLKANKSNLIKSKNEIEKIRYPFVLNKSDEKLKGYLACDMKQCFSVDENLINVIIDIESR